MRQILHAITPGDHFSPRTGSAVPTVIDGLARVSAQHQLQHQVLVAAGTYSERYSSATAQEYQQAPVPGRAPRVADLLCGWTGGRRVFQQKSLQPVLAQQHQWPPAVILAHNLVQLVPLVDHRRHQAVLYAHNDLLRTYSRGEAGKVLAGAALIVCVSEFLAEQLKRQLPAALHARIVVVPNAADCEQFTPGPNPTPADRDAPLRVVFMGRMLPQKGPEVLLRAAALLNTRRLQITLVGSAGFDAGAQPTAYERSLRRLAQRLPCQVTFRPFTDRHALPELLRAQDVLVVPSRWPEPWGLTVSEGQAAGLAVLASEVGGIPEAIADRRNLLPAGDHQALAGALQQLLEDRELLTACRIASRKHALAHDWSTSWGTLAEHLDQVQAAGQVSPG